MPKYRVPAEFEAMDDEHARRLVQEMNEERSDPTPTQPIFTVQYVPEELAKESTYWERVR